MCVHASCIEDDRNATTHTYMYVALLFWVPERVYTLYMYMLLVMIVVLFHHYYDEAAYIFHKLKQFSK